MLTVTLPFMSTALRSKFTTSCAGLGYAFTLAGFNKSVVDVIGSPNAYSPEFVLIVTPYVPASTGIFGPSCVPTPFGKSTAPQWNVHAPSALNLAGPVVKSAEGRIQLFSSL